MRSEQINELASALAKAQGAMKNAPYDRTNPHFRNKYASLASITDAIKEPLAVNGLSCSQATEMRDGGFVLVTTLMHSSGQWLSSEYPLPIAAKPQELGSAMTYARRYSLSSLVSIAADDDDDAEGARAKNQTASAPVSKAPRKPAANVMLEPPPYDMETGEVEDEPSQRDLAPAADPVPSSLETPPEGAGKLSVEDMAREAAQRGEAALKAYYKGRSPAEKKRLNAIGDELRGLIPTKAKETA